ncbi:hypothetical protein Tco_0725571 [Tanacetum coccineum]|uniref:Zinc finger, CCHC-type n=1 Tax=Tanacetum coccineum TaxID=301880 RepID=A0ABQ4YD95_9ASTR
MRLQTNTKTLEDLCSQSLETASQAIHDAVTPHPNVDLSGVASCDGCARWVLEDQLLSASLLMCLGKRDYVERIPSEDTTMSTYLMNRSPSSAIGFKKPIDMLGVFGWLASIKQGMLEPVKVKCIFLGYHKSIVARDMEYLACQLFGYREDSNEDAFAVAAMDKIYAHESLTFNNIVSCEVISKWKAGLKDDMDARSDVYVLSNGCRKCSDDSNGYYWEYTPGMFIHLFLYINDMVFYCGCKAEIWTTKGLLDKAMGNVLGMEIVKDQSGDCDVEKNGKWSCIYVVGSQEYQMVCTRLDKASTDVGSLKGNLQHMEALPTTKAGYMTFIEAWKKEIWLKGLLT